MSKMNFSKFQVNIFNEVENGVTNLAINAVAGSGKTTTIVECCKRLHLSKYDVKFLAFNNSIVKELAVKIGDYADVSTLHSHGFSVLKKVAGKERKFDVNDRKYINIIKNDNMLSLNRDDKDYIKALNNADKLLRLCRINLIKTGDTQAINDVADEYSIVPLANEISVVNSLLADAYTMDLNGYGKIEIDFTDMIVLPLSYKRFIPTYKVVFIDECQDLSKAQRELMIATAKGGRFVAVGDRRQAINGFAGADCQSFDKIAKLPNTKEMPLSVNYRCGRNMIALAQEIVPEIQAHDGAIDGAIEYTSDVTLDTFKANDMVLCRTAAPLVVMCLKLIRNGVTAVVKGRDIASGLIGLIDKSKKSTIKGFETWAENEKEKLAKEIARREKMDYDEAKQTGRYIAYCDRVDCILAIGEDAKTLEQVKATIEEIFNDTRLPNAVTFSTCHKSKGLESDRVVILLPNKLPLSWKGQQDWEYEQELNLKYVAVTRAKKELVFVQLEQNELLACDLSK